MKKSAREYASTGEHGVTLIKGFEQFHRSSDGGLTANVYRCPAGIATIGWGHTGPELREGMSKSRAECESILRDDLKWAEGVVQRHISSDITQTQFDALVAFIFNCGEGAFADSTLKRRVNAGSDPGDIEEAFLRFRKARVSGQLVELPGLVRRRRAEAALFNAPEGASVTIGANGDVVTAPAPAAPAPPIDATQGTTTSPTPPETAEVSEPGMPQRPLPAPQKPIEQSRTLWGALLAAIAGGLGFASVLWSNMSAWWAEVSAQLPFNPLWILAALFAIGILVVVLARIDDQFKHTR